MVSNEYNYKVGASYYGFNAKGVMLTGWNSVKYTSSSGTVDTDWYYYNSNGSAGNGWLQEGSVWYYCENGLMYRNGWFQTAANTYSLFDSSGVWIKSASEIPEE